MIFATEPPGDDLPGPGPGDDGLFVYRDLFNSLLNGLAFSRMICRNGEPVDFVFLAVNTAFTTQTGMTDVVGKRVCDLIPGFAETDRALLRLFNHVVTTGSPDRFEYFVSALGKWFLISAYSPKAEHFVAIFEDISARKQIEETLSGHQLALKQSEERYRTLTERAPIALVVHSGGQLIYANPAAVNLAGAKGLQDLLGRNVFELVHPEFRELAKQRSAASAQPGGMSPVMEQKYLKLDGSVIHVEVQSASITYDGAPAVQVVIHDITARKLAEQALARVNRALKTLNTCNGWRRMIRTRRFSRSHSSAEPVIFCHASASVGQATHGGKARPAPLFVPAQRRSISSFRTTSRCLGGAIGPCNMDFEPPLRCRSGVNPGCLAL